MSENTNKWSQVVVKLRRALELAPPSLEEADAEMAAAGEAPMTDEEIQRIADGVTGTDAISAFDPRPLPVPVTADERTSWRRLSVPVARKRRSSPLLLRTPKG